MSPIYSISNREKEVLDLISKGLTDREISNELFLSPHTVKSHRKRVIAKLGCNNAAAMVRRAFELQILQLKSA